MPAEIVERIARALEGPVRRLLLAGPEGAGRALAVEVLLAERGKSALRVDLAGIVADGGSTTSAMIDDRLAAALREAALRDAVAIIDGGSTISHDALPALARAFGEHAAAFAVPIVFTLVTRPAWLANAIPELVELTVSAPTFRERHELWQRALPTGLADASDLETVAARYAFTGGTIAHTARRALHAAQLRDPSAPA